MKKSFLIWMVILIIINALFACKTGTKSKGYNSDEEMAAGFLAGDTTWRYAISLMAESSLFEHEMEGGGMTAHELYTIPKVHTALKLMEKLYGVDTAARMIINSESSDLRFFLGTFFFKDTQKNPVIEKIKEITQSDSLWSPWIYYIDQVRANVMLGSGMGGNGSDIVEDLLPSKKRDWMDSTLTVRVDTSFLRAIANDIYRLDDENFQLGKFLSKKDRFDLLKRINIDNTLYAITNWDLGVEEKKHILLSRIGELDPSQLVFAHKSSLITKTDLVNHLRKKSLDVLIHDGYSVCHYQKVTFAKYANVIIGSVKNDDDLKLISGFFTELVREEEMQTPEASAWISLAIQKRFK